MRVGQSRSPPVVGRVVLLPQEPDFARALSKQILARETHGNGKSLCAFADEHDVAGVLHDRLGDARNILDVTNAADGSRAARRPMHAAGVEFDHSLFIGKAAEADRIVIRIVFRTLYNPQGGVERVATIFQVSEGVVEIIDTVVGTNDDRALGGAGGFGGASRIVFNSVLNFVLRVQTSRIQASGQQRSDCGT